LLLVKLQIVSLKNDGSDNGNSAKGLKSHTKIHEHDFIASRIGSETSVVCSTCGLPYCENCGKLVNVTIYDTGT
jgi:hypothetical protein